MTYFRVSASVLNWYFILLVMVWRQLMKSSKLQRAVHRPMDGKVAVLFQWYSVFFAGILCMMMYSIFEVSTTYMVVSSDEIDKMLGVTYFRNVRQWSDDLKEKFEKSSVEEVTFEEFRQPLKLNIYLRVLSIMSFIIGIPVVLVSAFHTFRLVFAGAKIADENKVWGDFPFKPTRRLDWVLIVIAMPATFSQASMRATNRMWALMVGKAEGHDTLPWPRLATLEHALYTNDLEIAALFQFCAVYCFARLCMSYLTDNYLYENLSRMKQEDKQDEDKKDANANGNGWSLGTAGARWFGNRSSAVDQPPAVAHVSTRTKELEMEDDFKLLAGEFKRVIRTAAFLGVWSFIVFGFVRCIFDITIAELQQKPDWAFVAERAQEDVMDSMSTVFTVLTILCVINMYIICNLKMITGKLDAEGDWKKVENANSKFLGTRMLLLLAEVQPKILAAFTVGSTMYKQAARFKEQVPLIGNWTFSYEQALLLHSCLLNIECLIVVVWNLITWFHLDMNKARLMKFQDKPGLLAKVYDKWEDRRNARHPANDKEQTEEEKHWWSEILHF